jgi:hypothetical protein
LSRKAALSKVAENFKHTRSASPAFLIGSTPRARLFSFDARAKRRFYFLLSKLLKIHQENNARCDLRRK